jgi:hypothetical protein
MALARRLGTRALGWFVGRRAGGAGTLIVFAVLAAGGLLLYARLAGERADTVRCESAVVERDRDAWRALAEQGAVQFEIAEEGRRQAAAAVRALQGRLVAQEGEHRARIARIRAAPPEDDGPVAPVLAAAIEALP